MIRLSSGDKRPFAIDIGKGNRHHISWFGLIQAATAAKHLECDYLWLDLLCIHQRNPADKGGQVRNMSRIYKNATAVLVMFGGCLAAQGVEYNSSWIERAWTLQESTINDNTWALIGLTTFTRKETQKTYIIASVGAEIRKLKNGIGLIKLRALLDVDINQPLGNISYPGLPNDPSRCNAQIKCFGNNLRSIETMKIIIDRIKSDSSEDKAIVKSAAWSSIWMRTSTEPLDMVFSIMHLLDVDLSVDYHQSLEDLYLELARKSSQTPVWLIIAPYAEITEGLVPMPPNFRPNLLPVCDSGEQAFSRLVDIDCMIAWTDIIVNSESPQFELCGVMIDVGPISTLAITDDRSRNISFLAGDIKIDTQCILFKDVGEIAMIVGQGWKKLSSSDSLWIIFLGRSDSGRWKKVGQGILTIDENAKGWLSQVERRYVKVGTNTETYICECPSGKEKGQFQFPRRFQSANLPEMKPNEAGVDPFAKDNHTEIEGYNEELCLAAKDGLLERVKWLIDHGADVAATDEYERTALHVAAEYGHSDVVELLLEKSALIGAQNEDAWLGDKMRVIRTMPGEAGTVYCVSSNFLIVICIVADI